MNKRISLDKFDAVFSEVLLSGGEVVFTVNGTSMTPLFKNGEDEVVLKKSDRPLKKYDIAFYRRKNGAFVLHRIVGKDENGYICCGDGQCALEKGVTDDMIIAIATHIVRGGIRQELYSEDMMKYAKRRVASRRLRYIKTKIRSVIKH